MRHRIKNKMFVIGVAAGLLMTGCQSNTESSAETEALKAQIAQLAQLEQQIADLQQQQSAAGNDGASNASVPVGDENSMQGQADRESGSGVQTGADSQQPQNDTGVGNSGQSQNDTGVGNSGQPQNDTSVGNSGQSQNDAGVGNSQQSGGSVGSGAQVPYDSNPGYGHSPGHDEGYGHNQSHYNYNGNNSASNQQGVSANGLTTYTMDELSVMVDAFVTKAGAAAPSGQAAQDMEQFFALKQEEKQIDDALDSHEDELEYLYKTGSLTREVYKQEERKLELLEDQLDDIEDQLEYVFGIKD